MDSFSFSFSSMGCQWTVKIWDVPSKDDLKSIKNDIYEMTNQFDKSYSRFIQDSLIFKNLRSPGTYQIPKDLMDILHLYQDFFSNTNNKFTPLIGQLLSDLGYDHDYSFKKKEHISGVPNFLNTVIFLDENTIKITEPILLDIGGLGKGYWVDRIVSYLTTQGINSFLVDGSGDIFFSHSGKKQLKVGLEHPLDQKKVIGKVELNNKALCGSGINRRSWKGIHHIVDPDSLKSTDSVYATWVIADKTVYADGIATCLFLLPAKKLQEVWDFEYLILRKDMSVEYSPGFNVELF